MGNINGRDQYDLHVNNDDVQIKHSERGEYYELYVNGCLSGTYDTPAEAAKDYDENMGSNDSGPILYADDRAYIMEKIDKHIKEGVATFAEASEQFLGFLKTK